MSRAENLYILGHPVGHSKSPVMYNALYSAMGLNWRYGFADCETHDEAQAFLDARDFMSINITTPYKPLAFQKADILAASAQLAEGANVLVNKESMLIGYNVDGQGCIDYLKREGVVFQGASVVVCGTGPTSLAIVAAASQAGAAEVCLLGRNKEKARDILVAYADRYRNLASAAIDLPAPGDGSLSFAQAYEQTSLKFGSYGSSTQAIAAADIIIDATPLGMKPNDPAPFDTALLSSKQIVFDVVYGHGVTALVSASQDAGCRCFDGAGMLVAQAVATAVIVCEINGVEIPYSTDEMFEMMAQAAGFIARPS